MASYSLYFLLASLHIEDTPIAYTPPLGSDVSFQVVYNQREANQPMEFDFSNLGPKWTFNWLSYVTDNPSDPAAGATVFLRGGGREVYANWDSKSQSYDPAPETMAVLVRIAPSTYERRLPDGSKEIFNVVSGSTNPRRVFLKEIRDPVNNPTTLTYHDNSLKIEKITDALGQQTTLEEPLKGDSLKVTKVTDPFGRFAQFDYEAGELRKITDPVGIQSQFSYEWGSDFINQLTTPYGSTSFAKGESGDGQRWLEATDPRGGKERVEYDAITDTSAFEALAPEGAYNFDLHRNNTYYWDKRAMAEGAGDYSKARVIHWLVNGDGTKISGIKHSEKRSLENRVWYTYVGQLNDGKVGTNARPTEIARVLDDFGTEALFFNYNALGNVTKKTDARGRVTTYEYATNQIDLVRVFQRNPVGLSQDTEQQNADLLAELIYDPSEPAHRPKIVWDVARQPTTYHYNAEGQLLSVKNARNEITTYTYGDGASVPAGYLAFVTSPDFEGAHAVTSFTYDTAHRVRTETLNPDGYVLTFDYDNIDRPTQISYPDGTTKQFSYINEQSVMTLDLTGTKDRLGRGIARHYNSNRQLDSVTDALGRTTTYEWCACGSLSSITDANSNVTTFDRDLQSRVTSKVFGGKTDNAVHYTYENATGRLKSMTDALDQTTNYEYFADGRLKRVSYVNARNVTPEVSYTYDQYLRPCAYED